VSLVVQLSLSLQHSRADPLAAHQRGIEGLREVLRGLDEHAVAHRRDGRDAALQELTGDGSLRLFF
jgi:hypothetical protein